MAAGIRPTELTVTVEPLKLNDLDIIDRSDIRKAFSDLADTLGDGPAYIRLEDECADCGLTLWAGKCPNVACVSNIHEEQTPVFLSFFQYRHDQRTIQATSARSSKDN